MRKPAKPFQDSIESNAKYSNNKERYEHEVELPVRSTKDISDNHKAKKIKWKGGKPEPLNEEGKELFDFVLKGLSTPDNQ